MQGWMLLWKIVFVAGLALFLGVFLWVTFTGANDIKKLFIKLNRKHSENNENRQNEKDE